MKILVFVKEVVDVQIPLACGATTGWLKPDWNVSILDPASASALEAALEIKDCKPGTHVTVVHLGAPSGERWVREGIALGCDEGLRVWEEGLHEIQATQKALIFARLASMLGFDLICVGARSSDTGNGQVGTLLAAHLDMPCVTSAHVLGVSGDEFLEIVRGRDPGCRERLHHPLPLIVTMEPREGLTRSASLSRRIEANDRGVPSLGLAQIGTPDHFPAKQALTLSLGPLRFPQPRTRSANPPDPSLPAFDRISRLLSGPTKGREGTLVRGNGDELVEELFRTLVEEGWLTHLRAEGRNIP